jgi:negative regulator of flagellin synthesis FlgM
MDIRNNLDGLKSMLGVPQTNTATPTGKGNSSSGLNAVGSDLATFSSAGSAVSQAMGDSSVRMDKVANIQAALAAGTYSISPAAIASRLVDSMLGSAQ